MVRSPTRVPLHKGRDETPYKKKKKQIYRETKCRATQTPARTPFPDPLPGSSGAHTGATCVTLLACEPHHGEWTHRLSEVCSSFFPHFSRPSIPNSTCVFALKACCPAWCYPHVVLPQTAQQVPTILLPGFPCLTTQTPYLFKIQTTPHTWFFQLFSHSSLEV